MKLHTLRRASGVAAVGVVLASGLAACGGNDSSSSATDSNSSGTTGSSTSASGDQFGAGCKLIPTSGKGSFQGMVSDPVATAASNNPLLSTLVTAVGAAGLADTLNGATALTVFAPDNDAFKAIPQKTLMAVLADKNKLTAILTHHVLGERLDPSKVVGTQTTLDKDSLTVAGDTSGMTVQGTVLGGPNDKANVVCGNIQTKNATVYVIDKVLAPAG